MRREPPWPTTKTKKTNPAILNSGTTRPRRIPSNCTGEPLTEVTVGRVRLHAHTSSPRHPALAAFFCLCEKDDSRTRRIPTRYRTSPGPAANSDQFSCSLAFTTTTTCISIVCPFSALQGTSTSHPSSSSPIPLFTSALCCRALFAPCPVQLTASTSPRISTNPFAQTAWP